MSYTVFNNPYNPDEIKSIIADNKFRMPDENEAMVEGFDRFIFKYPEDDELFVGAVFLVAEKRLNRNYLERLAMREMIPIEGPEFKPFCLEVYNNVLHEIKPQIIKVPVIQHTQDAMLMIGTSNKNRLEHIISYFNKARDFYDGGLDLADIYVTPPMKWEYNNTMVIMDMETKGKITLKNHTLSGIQDMLKEGHLLINIGFLTDYEGIVTIYNSGILAQRLPKDGPTPTYQHLAYCFDMLTSYEGAEKVEDMVDADSGMIIHKTEDRVYDDL